MSNKLFKEAIFTSIASIEAYFQKNKVDSSNLTYLLPVAITAQKKPTGWGDTGNRKGLLDIVSIQINKKIRIVEFDRDLAPDINGVCLEKTNSAIIYVNKGLNFCYRRLVVAKELSHLLMNVVNSKLRIATTKNELLDLLSFLTTGLEATNDCKESEFIAYFGAMELLIPKQYFNSDWFQSNNNNHDIAVQIKCPTQIIEIRKIGHINKNFKKVYQTPDV